MERDSFGEDVLRHWSIAIYGRFDPSRLESLSPTDQPTAGTVATKSPTLSPTIVTSGQPSVLPSFSPTNVVSSQPSVWPSLSPTNVVSSQPSVLPSLSPTNVVSGQPSVLPSLSPTNVVSGQPSVLPTISPAEASFEPSSSPTLTLQPSFSSKSAPSPVPSFVPSD
eukprot:jgi/Psemu1/196681/e_gw1.191.9.1